MQNGGKRGSSEAREKEEGGKEVRGKEGSQRRWRRDWAADGGDAQ